MQLQMFATVPDVLRNFEKQFPKAVAVALTQTGWEVRKQLMRGMQTDFDRPTPFTMRAFRVDAARSATMTAVVWAAPAQAKYLQHQIEGGERGTKAFERKMRMFGERVALPSTGAKLNSYGNMSVSFIKSVAGDQNSYGTAKRFFTGVPRGQPGAGAGIWARVNNNQRLVKVMTFADSAEYKERFDASAIAGRAVDAVFESQLMRAIHASAAKQ